ncbi:MAG: hypothetical protein JST92_20655, partial [Deltaproteobacteria bacterium]|nr:hypothetical protein [Deltaproteobacteria bacterium]
MNTGRLSARRPGARQLDPALRQFSAMLRWRARWMLRKAAPDTATAARLLPVLLQANFAHPLLRKDAPGVRGLRFRHAWVVWAKRFSLAPPQSMQRDAEAVAAVVVLPLGAQLEVLVITQPNLDLVARQRLDARMSALNTVFGVTARELRVRAVDASALTVQERELCIAFGGLVAGECPARLLEAGEPEEFPAVNLALRAPTTLAALAMMMVAGRPLAGAAESFQVLLASGVSARELADPDVACVRWASPYTLRGKMLDAALRWTRPARPKAERPGAFELLAVGRGLAISCAMSVRSLPLALGLPLRERLRREVLAPGLPRILVPLLSPAALKFEAAAAAHGVHTVALADGAVAGQGRTAVQARVRALSLRAQTNAPPLAQSSPVYEIIEARIGRPVERPTLLCVLEHAHVPGPPFDLLNRGPERRMALRSATLVLLRPDRRPTAWRVRP